MNAALTWARDGRDWPNREASRFLEAGGLRWHVQVMGHGPSVLLIHGTGASSHSWRDVAPLLARDFTVIIPDLPGHGFTQCPDTDLIALPAMARALAALLDALDVAPRLIIAHSAGVAIAMRLVLDGGATPAAIVSINGALLPFKGMASQLFPSLARMLVLNPFVPRFFAWRASSQSAVESLLRGTGSKLDASGVALYGRLFSSHVHVAATLAMMANWELEPLGRQFDRLDVPVLLLVGENDQAVPPSDAEDVAARLPRGRIVRLPGVGHLAHEEQPDRICDIVRRLAIAESVIDAPQETPHGLCADVTDS